MTTVDHTQSVAKTYTYDDFVSGLQTGAISSDTYDNVSVFTQSADSSQCTDGEDDGKIGVFSALGNALKGGVSAVVNGVKGMFTDSEGNFSLTQTLKTAGMTALCFIPGIGTAVAAGLCTVGVVKSGVGLAKGISAAATAETDAEAKAAWQSIGANTTTGAISAVGLKASTTALADQAGVANAGSNSMFKNISETVKNVKNAASEGSTVGQSVANAANKLTGNYYKGTWQNAKAAEGSTLVNAAKSLVTKGAKGTAQNMFDAADAVKKKVNETTDKLTGKSGQYTADSASAMEQQLREKGYTQNSDGNWTKTNKDGSITTAKVSSGEKGATADYSTSAKPSTKKVTNSKTGDVTETVKNTDGSSVETVTDKSGNVKSKTTTNADGSKSVETFEYDTTGNVTVNKKSSNGDTSTIKRDSYGYEQSNSSTTISDGSRVTTTDFNPTEIQSKYKLTSDQLTTLKNGGSVTTESGVTLTTQAADDMASVTIKTKANVFEKAGEFKNQLSEGAYRTVTVDGKTINSMSEGQANAAAWGVASSLASSAAGDITDSIDTASTTYVSASGTSGVSYTLENYTLPTDDEMNQTYSEIFNSVL